MVDHVAQPLLHQIPAVRHAVRDWLSPLGLDRDTTHDVLLTTCEALSNAIEHGQNAPVVVIVRSNVTAVSVSVRDYGIGLKEGDVVLFTNWAGDEFKEARGENILLMRADDILAVIDE